MNDEEQSRAENNLETLKKGERGELGKDEELGKLHILADTRRRYNVQDEFVYLLYNEIAKNFLEKWRTADSTKSLSKIEIQEKPSSENEGANKIEENERSEKSLDKGPKLSDWKLSLPDEYVEIEFPNKNIYAGHVSRRQMEGHGTYRWGSGETYKGEFEENKIEGNGRMEWKDQSWYEGEFQRGHRHGTGNFVSHEYRRFYIGKWHMGRKEGNGYCRYGKNDDFYEGEWKMDLKHGTGLRVYENGARYIGQWENDERNGIGTMVWPNGDVYRGEWKDGTMNGYGQYVWKGFFNESLSWPQENIYIGEWLHGMRHGRGDLKLNSSGGAKYSGDWYMDKKHGRGMIIGNSGGVTEADPLFLDDILTPQGAEASDFQKLDSESEARESEELLAEHKILTSQRSAATNTRVGDKEPRRTTVFDPLQCPSVSFHVQRLLDPSKYPEKSSAVSVSSGKCHMCESDSECACLYESSGSKSTATCETIETPLDVSLSVNSYDRFCKNGGKPKADANLSKKLYEEHWVHNCVKTHMTGLRKVYKIYAELYCSKKDNDRNLSMGKIALWQLMRDTGIHRRGISLAQFERYIANNKSAFIETEFYPFERIEFFQFLQSLLEISWHLYTKLGDIETVLMRGRLAGGLHRLLVQDVFPNAGKVLGNVSTTYRDLLPMYSIYQLYCDLGEPHTAQQFLRATCILTGAPDPKPLPFPKSDTKSIPRCLINGINAITVGEKLSFIPLDDGMMDSCSPEESRTYDDELAHELFALRHLGAQKMLTIMGIVCPGMRDEETDAIVNMDYELTFLEFYEILIEATKALLSMKKVSRKEFETSGSLESQTSSQSVKSFARSKRLSSSNSKIRTRNIDSKNN